MLGASIGDVVGSIYEFRAVPNRNFPLLTAESTFTDDTACTIAVALRIPGSGARTKWLDAMPADPAGLINVGPILVTPDGGRSVYSYTRMLSDLYLVDAR